MDFELMIATAPAILAAATKAGIPTNGTAKIEYGGSIVLNEKKLSSFGLIVPRMDHVRILADKLIIFLAELGCTDIEPHPHASSAYCVMSELAASVLAHPDVPNHARRTTVIGGGL